MLAADTLFAADAAPTNFHQFSVSLFPRVAVSLVKGQAPTLPFLVKN